MANSLSPLIPAYLASRVDAKMYFGIKTFGPAPKISHEREPWSMPWAFTVARFCEVTITVLLIVEATLLISWLS